MGWTIRYSSGVICVPLDGGRADALALPPMVAINEDAKGTAYTVSCDAAVGVSTGISATDRALTARILADPRSQPAALTRPGHVFPLRAVKGGVRERPGHTEAAVELCQLAGLEPVGVIAEVVYDNGEMMRLDGLRGFALEHGCPLISIADLVAYLEAGQLRRPCNGPRRDGGETMTTSEAQEQLAGRRQPHPVSAGPIVQLPTAFGDFVAQAWTDLATGAEHLAVSSPLPPVDGTAPLVRLHSECLTGDVFGSYRCDCGEQLAYALELINELGGTLLYLRGQEGRGIGLANKMKAYALQEAGFDTVEANEQLGLPVDARCYKAAAQILADMGLHEIRLLSNNPDKQDRLAQAGVRVVEMVPTEVPSREQNIRYLQTKKDRMDHRLVLDMEPAAAGCRIRADSTTNKTDRLRPAPTRGRLAFAPTATQRLSRTRIPR